MQTRLVGKIYVQCDGGKQRVLHLEDRFGELKSFVMLDGFCRCEKLILSLVCKGA